MNDYPPGCARPPPPYGAPPPPPPGFGPPPPPPRCGPFPPPPPPPFWVTKTMINSIATIDLDIIYLSIFK